MLRYEHILYYSLTFTLINIRPIDCSIVNVYACISECGLLNFMVWGFFILNINNINIMHSSYFQGKTQISFRNSNKLP